MDVERAKKIVEAPYLINVDYRGIPVYIEKIHEENGLATVFPLDQMDQVQLVDVEGLFEKGPTIR